VYTPRPRKPSPNGRKKRNGGRAKAVQKRRMFKNTDIYNKGNRKGLMASLYIGGLLLISPSFTYLPKVYNKRAKEQA
jgi:hypothetical protein